MTPAELSRLHAASFETPRPWSETEFSELLDTPGCFLVTAPGGFALGRVIEDEAELLTLAVAPEARRLGHGSRLLSAFEDAARARGAASAFLEVSAGNSPAIALYLSQRYSETGRRRSYYRAPDGARIDALVFTRPLA